MARQRKRKNGLQLEFESLVAAAEFASESMAAQIRERRRLERAQRKAVRLLQAPTRSNHHFDGAWIKGVRKRIRQSDSLRAAVVLAATKLSELVDLEIEEEGHDPEWREKYDAFCAYKKSRYDSSEDELDRMLCVFWELSRELFEIYYSLNTMSDWALFERACSGEVDNLEAADVQAKQASLLEYYAQVVTWMHMSIVHCPPWEELDEGDESET